MRKDEEVSFFYTGFLQAVNTNQQVVNSCILAQLYLSSFKCRCVHG